jgi:hypothetical protein
LSSGELYRRKEAMDCALLYTFNLANLNRIASALFSWFLSALDDYLARLSDIED